MSKEKKGCLHGCLVLVIIMVVIIVLIIGGVVGATMFFKQNIPEPVTYTVDDEVSFYEKTNIKEENYDFNMMDLLQGNVTARGSVEVDTSFTSEELTAFFSGHSTEASLGAKKASRPLVFKHMMMVSIINASPARASHSGQNLFADFNIRLVGEDKMEVFASISEDISGIYDLIDGLDKYAFIVDRGAGTTLHIVMNMTYMEGTGFDIVVDELRVNGAPVPQNLIDQYEPDLNNLLNKSLRNNGSFTVEAFKITSDELIFKGTIPEYLESIK